MTFSEFDAREQDDLKRRRAALEARKTQCVGSKPS